MSELTQDWLYQRIVALAQDAIIFADRDGIIQLWNAGAETIFGYRANEAMGQTLDLIVPPRLQARHWEGYRRVMATGVTKYGRDLLKVPANRKDGVRISVEFTVVPIQSAEGAMLGIAAIIRDVTARWEEDRLLQRHLAELEERCGRQATSGATG